jgi:hypothetical protein
VQSIVFYKNRFTRQEAIDWAHRAGFSTRYVGSDAHTWRIRQRPPSEFKRFAFSQEIEPGVRFVYGFHTTRRPAYLEARENPDLDWLWILGGVAVVGGVGWWIWSMNQPKAAAAAPAQVPTTPPGQTPTTPTGPGTTLSVTQIQARNLLARMAAAGNTVCDSPGHTSAQFTFDIQSFQLAWNSNPPFTAARTLRTDGIWDSDTADALRTQVPLGTNVPTSCVLTGTTPSGTQGGGAIGVAAAAAAVAAALALNPNTACDSSGITLVTLVQPLQTFQSAWNASGGSPTVNQQGIYDAPTLQALTQAMPLGNFPMACRG